jgi:hypothetical protein
VSATTTGAPASVEQPARARWWSSRPATAAAGVAVAALVIGICVWPLIDERTFLLGDWFLHQWYVWHQEGSLRAHLLPSLYAHDASGVFDPHFAFYGGTLYAITAAIALAVGHEAAFVASWILILAMAYGAWFWLARQAGLGPWASHAPGVLFVTSTWCLTSVYVLASWAQMVAFCSLVLVLAAAFAILRADRLRPLPALALAVGVLLYTGSHNLTLVWGTTVVAVVGAAALALIAPLRGLVTRRGLLRLAVVAVPATLVNAWFLVPAAVYQSHTVIGSDAAQARLLLQAGMDLVAPGHTLTLTRTRADPLVPRYALQLPMLAIAWTAIGLLLLWARRGSAWFRTAGLMLVVIVATWVLMTNSSLILALPPPYDMLQAAYRLQAYVQLALACAVIALLVLMGRGPSRSRSRVWAWALVAVLSVSVLQARAQIREPLTPPLKGPLSAAFPYHQENLNYPGTMDYVDARVPLYTPDRDFTKVRFSPMDAERTDRAEVTVDAQPGEAVWTNLKASPELVEVSGARFIARDPGGNAFLEVAPGAEPGAARIVVTTKHPWPVMLGRLLTLLGVLGLAGLGVALLMRARRPGAGV